MKEKLLEIAKKYSIKNLEEQVGSLNYNLTLTIGFLGEFSSGKSTLINSLLGKKVLPAMEKPTTKSIIEIIPTSTAKNIEYYERQDDGKLIPISPLDFQEIAVGRKEGKAGIKVKPSDIFQENYLIVDTPGISSLEKTDVDITYGYLPFLDGAIICQDINYGTLTDSILNFLSMPAIAPITNNFIFALTKSDTKSREAAEKIRENVVKLLADRSDELGMDIKNIQDRVVVVSALKALEENNRSYIEEIIKAFRVVILNKKKTMLKYREQKELKKIAETTVSILSNIKENLDETDETLEKKEAEIKAEIKKLEKEKKKYSEKLEKFKERLCDTLNKIAERHMPAFSGVNNEDDLDTLINDLVSEITLTSEKLTKSFMDNIEIPSLKYIGEDLRIKIKNTMNLIEQGKLIGTAALAAVVIPEAGIADLVQAAFGATLQTSTKISQAMKKTEEKTKTSSLLREILEPIGMIQKKINPLEYLGDFIKQKLVSKKAKSYLYSLAYQLCDEITNEVKIQVDDIVFSKLNSELESKVEAIETIGREKINKKLETEKIKKEIDKNISDLKGFIGS